MEELDLYILTFDRAGYGESDPNPRRSVKSEAFDLQELADKLNLGPKFYLMGASIGTYCVWSCIKYIPHRHVLKFSSENVKPFDHTDVVLIDLHLSSRLAGVMLIVPVINFWWPSFPPELVSQAFKQQLKRDQWKLWIAHHTPALVYWWMTQRLFPYSSIMQRHPILLNERDLKTIQAMSKIPNPDEVALLPFSCHAARICFQETVSLTSTVGSLI